MVKSSPKSVFSRNVPKLSFTYRVIIGIIAVVLAYLIVKFGISTFEGFTTSSDSLGADSKDNTKQKTIVNLYSMKGCGYCEKSAPEWKKLQKSHPANSVLTDGSTLVYNYYSTDTDTGAAQITKDKINGFPTITIQYANATSAVPYESAREEKVLWAAIDSSGQTV